MVFGLGTKTKKKPASKKKTTAKGVAKSKKVTAKSKKSSAQADEAAQLLKNMQSKKDAGDCPFC